MYSCLTVTLDEVVQVRGNPLNETELWSILRKVIPALTAPQGGLFTITAQSILLMPNGEVVLSDTYKESTSEVADRNFQELFQDVALTLLWCAAYNLDESKPLDISSSLQTLLSTMCEQPDICTADHIKEICNHQFNAKPVNDSETIVKLFSSIFGSLEELHLEDVNPVKLHDSTFTSNVNSCSLESTFSADSVSGDSKCSCFFGEIHKTDTLLNFTQEPPKPTNQRTSHKKEVSTFMEKQPKRFLLKYTLDCHFPDSVLKPSEAIPSLYIDPHNSSGQLVEICVQYLNHSKLKVITRNCDTVTALDVIQTALNAFLKTEHTIEKDQLTSFALARWEDSVFYFFDNTSTVEKMIHCCPNRFTFYIRVLFLPPDMNTINAVLLKSIYIQIRADIIDERIICLHDEALTLAALSLQCELGDYKPEYGCEYFAMEEFCSPHLISQLGLSYLRSELPTMHRQLAGIAEKEARLLFIRKSQRLDEYGMNFQKFYRSKSCKEENATWIGFGPKGITNFDSKDNYVRIKRHAFQWGDMKKISFKNRKVAITKLKPEVKLKFYEKEISRTKYVVTLIGQLHKYYSTHPCSSEISALSVFEDITKVSSNLKKKAISPSHHYSTPKASESSTKPQHSWTYNTPQFTRNSKPVRRRSSASTSTASDVSSTRKTKPSVPEYTYLNHEAGTEELVLKELKQVIEKAGTSNANNATFESKKKSTDSNLSKNNDIIPTPPPRIKLKNKRTFSKTYADNANQDDIHATARDFYRDSLSSDQPIPANAHQLNATLLKSLEQSASCS